MRANIGQLRGRQSEPLLTEETRDAADPEKQVEREESISLAFLVLLEQLHSFQEAIKRGDMSALTHLLAENVSLWTGGGRKTKNALVRPICEHEAVAHMSLASKQIWPQNDQVMIREIKQSTRSDRSC